MKGRWCDAQIDSMIHQSMTGLSVAVHTLWGEARMLAVPPGQVSQTKSVLEAQDATRGSSTSIAELWKCSYSVSIHTRMQLKRAQKDLHMQLPKEWRL